jgi:hypothetical protein
MVLDVLACMPGRKDWPKQRATNGSDCVMALRLNIMEQAVLASKAGVASLEISETGVRPAGHRHLSGRAAPGSASRDHPQV